MCRDTMDITSNHVKSDYLRQTTKFESSPKWKVFCVSSGDNKTLKCCRYRAARPDRKRQKRAQLAKLAHLFADTRNEKTESTLRKHHVPAGAMAPENTTQYLMDKVYEDMNQLVSRDTAARIGSGSASPSSVYAEVDCDYDGCLAFQQRDFEEMFGLTWKPE